MKRSIWIVLVAVMFGFVLMGASECESRPTEPSSTTGVKKINAKVKTGIDGMTVEQENVKNRIEAENTPGRVQHLYIVSAYSGDVILYSTVAGKVTSSGKRLTPYSVAAGDGEFVGAEHEGIPVRIGARQHMTGEVLQDDGTYGSSIPYLFWWDTKGLYHQHYVSGGQIVHVTEEPMIVPKIILNVEAVVEEKPKKAPVPAPVPAEPTVPLAPEEAASE